MPKLDFLTTGTLSKLEILADDTKTVLWAADPIYTKVLFVSNTYREIWNRESVAVYRNYQLWIGYLVPEEKNKVYAALKYRNTPINPKHTENYYMVLPDQSKQLIIDRCCLIHDNENKPLLIAGVALPISKSQLTGEANIIASDFIDAVLVKYYNLMVQDDQSNHFNKTAAFSEEISSLSKREKEVLKLILVGLTANQIAEKLFVSRRTAEAHTNVIKQKLNCDSKSEIISKAIENNCMHISIE